MGDPAVWRGGVPPEEQLSVGRLVRLSFMGILAQISRTTSPHSKLLSR
jgi:hypothetical protein